MEGKFCKGLHKAAWKQCCTEFIAKCLLSALGEWSKAVMNIGSVRFMCVVWWAVDSTSWEKKKLFFFYHFSSLLTFWPLLSSCKDVIWKCYCFFSRSEDVSPDTASPRESFHFGAFKSFLKHQWGKPGPGIAVPGLPGAPAECWQWKCPCCAGEEHSH